MVQWWGVVVEAGWCVVKGRAATLRSWLQGSSSSSFGCPSSSSVVASHHHHCRCLRSDGWSQQYSEASCPSSTTLRHLT
ncbi:hypothetical protein EDD17DRAFT_1562789 [Pisolithus thermaeus]|nr:hypothetical protein EDD17DRAFT_1562789 [Pisolithus thermaeus]